MTRFLVIMTLATVVTGCGKEEESPGSSAPTETLPASDVSFNVENHPTVAFSVEGMMCEHSCVPAVEEILSAQPGVKDIKVVLDAKTATVAVDETQFDADAAIAALADMQFEATALVVGADATDEAPASEVEASADEQG